ncbi:PDR/VanB family oxidoreductase [Burkholderia anthina]|uniref:PDR/VanB family oxidoreductase n=1 Tax=Burkholderia anthina TaxID=179879 RepID=UPI001ABA79B8|nr:PDR/VanB family oxidoreductase [Burkholderia anthina]
MKVKVINKHLEAQDIYRYELASVDGAPLPAFTAGAHIDVEVAPNLIRQYSLCSHPDERHRYEIAVLRAPGSRGGSEAMHDQIHEGDVITVSEPRNHFPLDPRAKRSLLLAGGIGVTPILSMAQRLSQQGADFEMHYCVRSEDSMAFRHRLAQAPYWDRVSAHFDDGPPEQKLDIGRLLSEQPPDTHLYTCGPTGFMTWILDSAANAGWGPERVHREYFGVAPSTSASDKAFSVKLVRSGKIIPVAPEQTVVAALSAQGVSIPVSCEQGVCGTCLTRVIAGEPDHRDMFLTDAEHALNDQFTPCCSRARSSMLVLDL